MRVGAQVGATGELGSSVGHGHERSSKFTSGANGGRRRIAAGARARARNEGGGVLWARRHVEAVSPTFVAYRSTDMGAEAVATCGGTGGQWRKAVPPPASVCRPHGTGLGHLRVSRALGPQWRRRWPQTAGFPAPRRARAIRVRLGRHDAGARTLAPNRFEQPFSN
jgi:hypothetical protein